MADCMKCANYKKADCLCACDNGESFKPITNADRIRAMSDEELALFIHNVEAQAADTGRADTVENWLEWLRQEAEA